MFAPDELSPAEQSQPPEKPQGEGQSPLKTLLVFLLLVVLIVGSFWVSFMLGKRLLSPARNTAERIQVAIPEPPASIAHLQKLAAVATREQVRAPVKHSVKTVKTVKKSVKSNKFYKIQAGLFAVKAQALTLSEKLNADGFETLVKKIGSSWRVQTGAYRARATAQQLQKSLSVKGYKSTIIVE